MRRLFDGPVEELFSAYRHYLLVERRLAPTTVGIHEDIARRFLMRASGSAVRQTRARPLVGEHFVSPDCEF
ncbi:MAG: hypothetical protein ACRDRX_08275 [Pseudonocardiaceae bacterium]